VSQFEFSQTNWGIGSLSVFVLDPLIAPSTVGQTVSFLVEVSGGSDYQFGHADAIGLQVAPPLYTHFVAQSGLMTTSARDPLLIASEIVGEKIQSVKQLISRSTFYQPAQQGTTVSVLRSFFNNLGSTDNGTSVVVGDGSYSAYFTSCYGLARGSTVFDILPLQPNTLITCALTPTDIAPYTLGNSANSYVQELNAPLHITLPYFGFNTRNTVEYTTAYPTPPHQTAQLTVGGTAATANTWRANIYYRAGDDAQLGMFLGCPPLILPYLNQFYSNDGFFAATLTQPVIVA
jgi:hypothetical protein